MAVKIRLKRMGKIRTPHYRIVVIDSRKKRDGRAIEQIGQYHPKNDPSVIVVDSERAQHWLSVGAQPTEAVVALFKRTGDWQQFSGDTSPSGVTAQPEKVDKVARLNAALAELGEEPTTDAIDRSGKAKEKSSAEAQTADTDAKSADAKTGDSDDSSREAKPKATKRTSAKKTGQASDDGADTAEADASDQADAKADSKPDSAGTATNEADTNEADSADAGSAEADS